jgi:SSS family solute:Na+ symporter
VSSGTVIFFVLIAGVTVLGFLAARWRRAAVASLDEWALGGRNFGTVVSWFLLGGDLYTAYTFIALPALAYGAGALAFFAVPYTTLAYPLTFFFMARFWTIAKRRGYVTAADFVHDRYGSRALELVIALTGVLAILPYIALQLIGMQTVLEDVGLSAAHIAPVAFLIAGFVLLAAYTFISGLRAPAMIAFVKDTLIYITVIAALAVIPSHLGGWAHIFASAQSVLASRPKASSTMLLPGQYASYATLALGSAMALFLYPHSVTGCLSARNANVIRRNCALLPLYSLLLAFITLLGFCALAAGIKLTNNNQAVPELFVHFFPSWFTGVAFAAIVMGALVPAAVMSIGAANLFASNILQSFRARRERPSSELGIARGLALCVLTASFIIAVAIKPLFAINFQLLGGAWIVQIFPAFVLGLYTRRLHPVALLAGWCVGMSAATWMAVWTGFSSVFQFSAAGHKISAAIVFCALLANLVTAAVVTLLLAAFKTGAGRDLTTAADYA